MEEGGGDNFKILSHYFPAETEEKHENPQSG
jgi:hypothetical protein